MSALPDVVNCVSPKDVDVKVSYLATFNDADFIDICQKRQIEIL